MSWWWMDVGARWMDGGDGNEGMRDAVVLSSAPGDAASAPFRDRTVTFTASAPFPIATEKADGSVPGASDAVDARSARDPNACSCGAQSTAWWQLLPPSDGGVEEAFDGQFVFRGGVD